MSGLASFPFPLLPYDLHVAIFGRLPAQDVPTLHHVCQHWRSVCNQFPSSLRRKRVSALRLVLIDGDQTVEWQLQLRRHGHYTAMASFTRIADFFADQRAQHLIFAGTIRILASNSDADIVCGHLRELKALADSNGGRFAPETLLVDTRLIALRQSPALDAVVALSTATSLTEVRLYLCAGGAAAADEDQVSLSALFDLLEHVPRLTIDIGHATGISAATIYALVRKWDGGDWPAAKERRLTIVTDYSARTHGHFPWAYAVELIAALYAMNRQDPTMHACNEGRANMRRRMHWHRRLPAPVPPAFDPTTQRCLNVQHRFSVEREWAGVWAATSAEGF